MQLFDSNIKNPISDISSLELKQLLYQIVDSTVCFRFRPIGGMWMKNLMKVSAIRENSVVLFDEKNNKYHLIGLNDIMQFEIDERFQVFQPYFHYDVMRSTELA
jgi:hypothetical protein